MQFSSLGIIGAARASWFGDTYRSVIRELSEKNPKADISKIARLFGDRVERDPDLMAAVCEYVVANTIRAKEMAEVRARSPRFQISQMKSEIDDAAKVIQNNILILNLEMPNGKRLRHCDGNYVAKLGGGLAKAGKKAGSKLIGQVFDEKSLRTVMGI